MALRGLGVRVREALKHQQEPPNAQFMAAFCESIGMGGSRMDDQGQMTLSFSGKSEQSLVVTFVCQGPDSIAAVSYIGDIGKKEDNMKTLLELNFCPTNHGGASFALEPGSERLVMVNSWNVTKVSVQEFSTSLEQFVNSAEAGQAIFL